MKKPLMATVSFLTIFLAQYFAYPSHKTSVRVANASADYKVIIHSQPRFRYGEVLGTGEFEIQEGIAFEILDLVPAMDASWTFILKVRDSKGHVGFTRASDLHVWNEVSEGWAHKLLPFEMPSEWAGMPDAPVESATVWLKFVKRYPHSSFVPEAMVNAADCYWAAGGLYLHPNRAVGIRPDRIASEVSLSKAKEILQKVISHYPDTVSEQKAKIMLEKIRHGELQDYVETNLEQLDKK